MKKVIDITGISSELEGSVFFPSRRPADPPAPARVTPMASPSSHVTTKTQPAITFVRPSSVPEIREIGKPESRISDDPEVRQAGVPETRKSENPIPRESGKPETRSPIGDPVAELLAEFTLNEPPDYKETVLITPREYDVLEELKRRLRRQHDLKVTKQDLLRCAIYALAHDLESNPDASHTVRHLRAKKAA